MATTDDSPAYNEIRNAARRALVFQNYIFKKAWGIYYALWACAFAIYFFFPSFLRLLNASPFFVSLDFLLVVNLAISAVIGCTSGQLLERARKTVSVRNALMIPKSPFDKRGNLFHLWWVAYFFVIIIVGVFFNAHLLSVVFGLATTVTLVFYYALMSSFPGNPPPEGLVAIASFGIAATVSFAISLITAGTAIYGIIWGITILIWIGASIVSLLHANEELTKDEVSGA